jgi:hypothetical protein
MTNPPLPPIRPRTHLLALAGYLALGLVATYPLLLHFTTEGLGEHYFDRAQSIWNLWWIRTALLERGTNPFHTDLLFYPQGADLYFHDLSLPIKVIIMLPSYVIGLVGAYNLGMLLGLVLTGYAGFRLVGYLTGHAGAAAVGGVIIGFNPLVLEWLRGHINLMSAMWCVLCIEFYLRAWQTGRRRDMLLMGGFFALSVLTVGYYEIYLLIFFALHGGWRLLTTPGTVQARLAAVLRRAGALIGWGGGLAALLLAPYAWGAWRSLSNGQTIAASSLDVDRAVVDSADLLSFIVPDRDHWLLGIHAPWWQVVNPAIHEYTTLGLATVILAAWGAWRARRQAMTWLWVALAGLGVLLALGPILQVNGQQTTIPMPLALLQHIPIIGLMRAPERFVFLTYIALAALAGQVIAEYGVRIAAWIRHPQSAIRRPQSAMMAGLLGLLLIEMPLHVHYMEPMPTLDSMAALGRAPGAGAVLELPLTQHGWVDTPRMFNQIAHGRPITSGYLSRPIIDPYTQACSPFQPFSDYPRPAPPDIISPTLPLTPALLTANGVGFITVYKQEYVDPRAISPVPAGRLAALQALATGLGTPIADDAAATVYRVQPNDGQVPPAWQLGPDWHSAEQSGGQPFRWLNGAQGDFCVFSPAPRTAPLAFQVTSFATPRHLQVWVNDQEVLAAEVPADGALHPFTTPAIAWPAGPQRVRLVIPEGSASPFSLGQGTDKRELSLGFGPIRLGGGP